MYDPAFFDRTPLGEIVTMYAPLRVLVCVFCAAAIAWYAIKPAAAQETGRAKPMLVFAIDQGLPNEAVANGDMASLRRVVADIKAFESRYEVYALLANSVDGAHLRETMQLLATEKVKFMVDALSSAAITRAPDPTSMRAYDPTHGQEMSVAQLASLKKAYGPYFGGIRMMELFTISYDIHQTQFHGEPWALRWQSYWPAKGNFFDADAVEPYVQWAQANDMFVDFSDWFWSFDHRSLAAETGQLHYEDQLRAMLHRHPNVVIATYDNNEPQSRSRTADWVPFFRAWHADGARGFGLSDQDWLCAMPRTKEEMNCPAAELIDWAKNAYRDGAVMVQLEPVWYWWDFPRGSTKNDYSTYKTPELRGRATPNLQAFADAFGVRLPD